MELTERHDAAAVGPVIHVIRCVRSVITKAPKIPQTPKKLSPADLLKLQAPKPMPLADRQERIRFLEKRYGSKLRGQDIRFMKNTQLYALSEQAGYRRR